MPDKFYARLEQDLTVQDFEHSSVWGSYYAPEDIDDIVRWGISRMAVEEALAAVGWEDGCFFPLPVEAADTEWFRGKLFGVTATTPARRSYPGYVYVADSIDVPPGAIGSERYEFPTLFVDGEQIGLSNPTPHTKRRIDELGGWSLFPLEIEICVTGERWTYSPY